MSLIARFRSKRLAAAGDVDDRRECRALGPACADVVETAEARETGLCPRCGGALDCDDDGGLCPSSRCGFAY